MQKDKIGIALITCNRPKFFIKSVSSVASSIEGLDNIKFVVINDGDDAIECHDKFDVTNTEGKIGVGKAKNLGIRKLIEADCEHIFLMEDDVQLLSSKAFELYINTSRKTGIKHFNFGLHGNHNRDLSGKPISRKIINYPDGTKVVLYANVLGAFSYYHIDVLNSVGLMDEQFYNALEHVDHTYQIIKGGYHPYFRWFADVYGVDEYLKDIVPDHQESEIRSRDDFMENFFKNHERFVKKNDFAVVAGHGTPENDYSEEEVVENLKDIWKTHHQ